MDSIPHPSILFVDDEANILSALRRMFHGKNYTILLATSGAHALHQLAQQPVDLVVSDMHMPEQTGTQLLTIVKQRWPETMRIILTGRAEITDAMRAINDGEVYRYILKPWNEIELLTTIQDALYLKNCRDEKQRLENVVREQNEQLHLLNTSLEQKVEARTAELQQTMAMLDSAHTHLKKNFVTSIKVFTSLIEMRGGALAGHSRRVAEIARHIAKGMGLSDVDAQEIMIAGLLHDIGKIGIPDKILNTPSMLLSGADRSTYEKHALNGQAALIAIEQLQRPALFIHHHHERYDGLGFPDGLAMLEIPLGARILALANDFDALQHGMLEDKAISPADAVVSICKQAGKCYDPAVVNAFKKWVNVAPSEPVVQEINVKTSALSVGMVLSRDLNTHGGWLLVAKDRVFDPRLIEQVTQFERSDGHALDIYIYCAETEEAPAPEEDPEKS